ERHCDSGLYQRGRSPATSRTEAGGARGSFARAATARLWDRWGMEARHALPSASSFATVREMIADVRARLARQRQEPPSKYFYDALGSHLFEAIGQLPWYRITGAESFLLQRYAHRMVAPLDDPCTLVELGCGSGEKLALIGEALRERSGDVTVHLVDVSRT